jgi:hypothetical protein
MSSRVGGMFHDELRITSFKSQTYGAWQGVPCMSAASPMEIMARASSFISMEARQEPEGC